MLELTLSFNVIGHNIPKNSNIKLSVEVEQKVNDSIKTKTYQCKINDINSIHINDIDSAEYTVKFIMEGKEDSDTIFIDNTIMQSAEIIIDNIKFDDYDITQLLEQQAYYTHNFNGYGEHVTELFSKCLGCNGIVEFKFTTPLYLWLLENMG